MADICYDGNANATTAYQLVQSVFDRFSILVGSRASGLGRPGSEGWPLSKQSKGWDVEDRCSGGSIR